MHLSIFKCVFRYKQGHSNVFTSFFLFYFTKHFSCFVLAIYERITLHFKRFYLKRVIFILEYQIRQKSINTRSYVKCSTMTNNVLADFYSIC